MADEARPLLLHSLSVFQEIILSALEAVAPDRIVEIGSESGAFTEELVRWARAHRGRVVSIDPEHAGRSVALAAEDDTLELVTGYSPEALEAVEPADLYVIDGDHNYPTVSDELALIYGRGADRAAAPVCILHDVGWPSGRRDQYYAPERLGDRALEHTRRGGVRPGDAGMVDTGFRGMGAFAWATREGGPRNGVRSAVDELLERRSDLRFAQIPVVFGLGFVYPAGTPAAEGLEPILAPFDDHPLLRTLEENRLDLFLRVVELQDELNDERLRTDRTLSSLHDRIGALEAEVARLRLADPAGA